MSQNRIISIIAGVVVLALIAGGLWFWFAPDNPELSDVNESVERLTEEAVAEATPETTPEADEETPEATPEADEETPETTPETTPEADDSTPEATPEVEVEETPEATPDVTPAGAASADDADSGEAMTFSIDSERSSVEFRIDEVLRGEDVTVVGTTNQVAGDIRVDPANPANSEVGEILINARALETDASGRNRALRNFILNSSQDEYEFISFQPTALENMPDSVTVGEPFEFQIVGELTVKDTTQTVTFDATVTPVSETEIEGSAQTTVLYADFDLTIPEVPFVASVEDDVILQIDFVAVQAS